MTTLIKNGTLVTADAEYIADILVEDGKIQAIGQDLGASADQVIDAQGKYVLPGGVDPHVHLSFEFNGAKVRGFESSKAAAAGGTTTVIEFVNQIRGKGLVDSVEDYRKANADGVAAVDYSFHAVMTDPRPEVIEEIPDLAKAGYPVMKLFMAYKGMFFHADDDAILKSLLKAKEAGVTVMVHAENADAIDVLQRQLIAEGKTEPYYHAVSRPPIVEAEATRRAIYLAQLADAPLYIAHVTCREAVEEIAAAHSKGQPVLGGTVSIGCVESCVSRMLPEALEKYSALHPKVSYEIYSADGDDIREKLDRGELDFGILLEPVEAAKYDYLRLPYWETWGIVMRKDDLLAEKNAIGKEEVLSIPLILPRREIVQDNIAGWFEVERNRLNIFAGHNLLNNAALLVEAGLGYAVCVGGAFEIRGGENLCFVPFTPERNTGHVMTWKKNRVFHSAASQFRDYIRENIAIL